MKSPRKTRGQTLLELLLVIGVIVVAGVPIAQMAQSAYRGAKISDVRKTVAELVQNLEDGIGSRQSYHGLDNDLVISQKLAPRAISPSGGLETTYGPLAVEPYGSRNDGFRITLEDIPASHCADLVAALAPLAKEIRMGGAVVALNRRLEVESVGQCERGTVLEMDRWSSGFGLRAEWEAW